MASLETITKELLSVAKVGDVDNEEVEWLVNDLTDEVKTVDPVGSPVRALTVLRGAKAANAAFQLRTQFAFLANARTALNAADAIPITLVGRVIPSDPCWAPMLLPDWRCDVKANEQQLIIAKQFTQFNWRQAQANSEWATQKLDGTAMVFTHHRRSFVKRITSDTAMAALDQIAAAAAALALATPGSPVAAFASTVESALRVALEDKVTDMRDVASYVRNIAEARTLMTKSDAERDAVEVMTDYEKQSAAYTTLMLSLRSAMRLLQDASSTVPHKCVEASALSSTLRAKLTIMEDRFRLSCISYVKQELAKEVVESGVFQLVNSAISRLKKYFPAAIEIKTAQDVEARKQQIIATNKKAAEEMEHQQKADEERIVKCKAECEVKFLTPYTGGRVEVALPYARTESYPASLRCVSIIDW